MKRLSALSRIVAALIGGLVLPALPSHADDILGQIQDQVAGIVARTTGSIVTIEDLRGIELEDTWRESLRARPRGLRHQITDALNRLSDADIQVAVIKATIKPIGAALTEATKSRTAIAAELEALRLELAKNPDVTRLNVDIDQNHFDALTAKRAKLETEIGQLNRTLTTANPRMASLLAARTALNVQVTEAQSVLAADRQKYQSNPNLLTDLPKAGTGFCIGEGLIVTTADVLDGMSEPVVITVDGARIRTTVKGVDNETNIGLLQLNSGAELPALVFADSDKVAVGHFAISIGNQSGSVNAVALNVISGIRNDGMYSGRRFYPKLLQVAGTIAAGNSGAPLLNTRGEVIGMVVAIPLTDWTSPPPFIFTRGPAPTATQPGNGTSTALEVRRGGARSDQAPNAYSRSSVASSGYATPINSARLIIDDMRAGKPVQHCWIGISVTAVEKKNYNPARLDLSKTVTVNGVFPDSPALKAGVLKGDEVLSINGRPILNESDVRIVSALARPGDPITIVLNRPNGQKTEQMTLHAVADLRPPPAPRPTQPRRAP